MFSKRKTKKNLQLAFLVTTFGSLELKRFLTFPSAYLVELSCEKSLQVNPEIYISTGSWHGGRTVGVEEMATHARTKYESGVHIANLMSDVYLVVNR